jgi:hypothetical protein
MVSPAEPADLPDNCGIVDHSAVSVIALRERHPSPDLIAHRTCMLGAIAGEQ